MWNKPSPVLWFHADSTIWDSVFFHNVQPVLYHVTLSQFTMIITNLHVSHCFRFHRLWRHPIQCYIFVCVCRFTLWETSFATMTSTTMLLACDCFLPKHHLFYISFGMWFLFNEFWSLCIVQIHRSSIAKSFRILTFILKYF